MRACTARMCAKRSGTHWRCADLREDSMRFHSAAAHRRGACGDAHVRHLCAAGARPGARLPHAAPSPSSSASRRAAGSTRLRGWWRRNSTSRASRS